MLSPFVRGWSIVLYRKSFGVDIDRTVGLSTDKYRAKLGEVLARQDGAAASGPSDPGLSEAYALVAKELRLARSSDTRRSSSISAGAGGTSRRSSAAAAATTAAAATAVAANAGFGHRFSTSSSRTRGSAAGATTAVAGGERLEKSAPLPSDVHAASHGVGGGVDGSGGSGGSGAVPFLTGSGRYSRWQAPLLSGGRAAGQPAGASAGLGGFDAVGWGGRGGSGSGLVGAVAKGGGGVDSKVTRHSVFVGVAPAG